MQHNLLRFSNFSLLQVFSFVSLLLFFTHNIHISLVNYLTQKNLKLYSTLQKYYSLRGFFFFFCRLRSRKKKTERSRVERKSSFNVCTCYISIYIFFYFRSFLLLIFLLSFFMSCYSLTHIHTAALAFS